MRNLRKVRLTHLFDFNAWPFKEHNMHTSADKLTGVREMNQKTVVKN